MPGYNPVVRSNYDRSSGEPVMRMRQIAGGQRSATTGILAGISVDDARAHDDTVHHRLGRGCPNLLRIGVIGKPVAADRPAGLGKHNPPLRYDVARVPV